ncbi:hypothetical protein ABTZ93_28470 [Streptomyces sp. NPDC097941]|uniref:hypothetical protein n=1 Tax=Streptomyces sp. NPDC097941 TaxID=3155685 RepID=UPI0033166975
MRTKAALISPAALLLALAACSDGSGDSGSPADSATTSSSTATTAPPADAEAIRACIAGVDALYAGSPTTPSVSEYGFAYRSAVAAIAKAGEDFYNENDGLPSDWPS